MPAEMVPYSQMNDDAITRIVQASCPFTGIFAPIID